MQKVHQIASVNMPTEYSTTHYLVNSSRNRSRLINRKCEWILKVFSLGFLLIIRPRRKGVSQS